MEGNQQLNRNDEEIYHKKHLIWSIKCPITLK